MAAQLPLSVAPIQQESKAYKVICGGRPTWAAAIGRSDFQFRAFEVPQEQHLSRFQKVLEVVQNCGPSHA